MIGTPIRPTSNHLTGSKTGTGRIELDKTIETTGRGLGSSKNHIKTRKDREINDKGKEIVNGKKGPRRVRREHRLKRRKSLIPLAVQAAVHLRNLPLLPVNHLLDYLLSYIINLKQSERSLNKTLHHIQSPLSLVHRNQVAGVVHCSQLQVSYNL